MRIDTIVREFPFTRGVDTKSADQLVQDLLTTLENARFGDGRIKKRTGFTQLDVGVIDDTDLPAAPESLFLHDGAPCQINDGSLYAYSQTAGKWLPRSSLRDLTAVRVSAANVVRTTGEQVEPDAASNAGYTVYAWLEYEDAGLEGVFAMIVDASGGVIVDRELLSTTGSTPRCVALGNELYILYLEGANLRFRSFNTAAPDDGISAATTLAADAVATSAARLDIAVGAGGNAILAYNATAAPLTKIATWAGGGAFVASTTIALASDACIAVHYHAANNVYYVAFGDAATDGIFVYEYTVGLVAVSDDSTGGAEPATEVTIVAGYDDTATNLHVVYREAGNLKTDQYHGGFIDSYVIVPDGFIAAKAFLHDAKRICVLVYRDSANHGTYFLLDLANNEMVGDPDPVFVPKPIAKVFSGVAPHGGGYYVTPPSVIQADDVFTVPLLVLSRFQTVDGIGVTPLGLSKAVFDFTPYPHRTARLGKTQHIAGGIVMEYDGVSCFESGFDLTLDAPIATVDVGAGSMDAGQVQFKAVFSWYDAFGNLHRSAPTAPVTVDVADGDAVDLQVSIGPALSRKSSRAFGNRSNIMVEIYSTLADETVFYRCPNDTDDPYAPLYWSGSGAGYGSANFTRTVADAELDGNELLYTTGEILENDAPPPTNILVEHQGRLVLVSSEDPEVLWTSKRYVEGFGVAWSAFLTMRTKGETTGLASMDEKLIIFKSNRIYYVAGDGPDDAGNGNTFTEPRLVSSDVGCINHATIVETPIGLMFESANGFYLLTRGMEVVYHGARAEGLLDTFSTGVLVPDLRFVLFAGEIGSGGSVVYDYLVDEWCSWGFEAVDAIDWDGQLTLLAEDGTLWREGPTTADDAGTEFDLRLITGWLKPQDLFQGFQRIRRLQILGDGLTAADVTVKVYYDFKDSDPDTYDDTTGVFAADGTSRLEIHLKRQKCSAIKVEVIVAGVVGAARNEALTALSLEVAVAAGLGRLIPAKRIS